MDASTWRHARPTDEPGRAPPGGHARRRFTISTKPAGLFLHVKSKHDKEEKTPEKCFPCLKGFDPDAKAAPAAGGGGGIKVAQGAAKKKVSKKKDADDLSALLADGLKVGKKKK